MVTLMKNFFLKKKLLLKTEIVFGELQEKLWVEEFFMQKFIKIIKK